VRPAWFTYPKLAVIFCITSSTRQEQ